MTILVKRPRGYGSALRQIAGALVIALLFASSSQATDAYNFLSTNHNPSDYCKKKYGDLDYPKVNTLPNQYVLLLAFTYSAKPTVQEVFHALTPGTQTKVTAAGDYDGCIEDPKDPDKPDDPIPSGKGLIVQGSCPSDCVKNFELRFMRKRWKHGEDCKLGDGDPLSHMRQPIPTWGIFFADATGNCDVMQEEDGDTHFRVFQIMVRDTKHAGLILKSLKESSDSTTKALFTSSDYLGQMLIGYNTGVSPQPK